MPMIPFMMAIGVVGYFSATFVFPVVTSLCLIVCIFIIILSWSIDYILIHGILFVLIGFLCASIKYNDYHKLQNTDIKYQRDSNISGTIESIQYGQKMYITLGNISINGDRVMGKVRLRTDPNMVLSRGQYILSDSRLYNAKNYNYRADIVDLNKANGIVAYGITSRVLIIQDSDGFYSYIDKIKSRIIQRIWEVDNQSRGAGIVAALIIGSTGYINNRTLDNIRKSGFAHLFAISGLHIGVIAGTIFLATRHAIARIPYLALRYNIKKIAAIISIFTSIFYLQLTNVSVSALRSVIMFCLFMFAILLDRKQSPIRIWIAAATTIIFLWPEKIFTPSFQMSFIATLSLILVYGYMREDNISIYKTNILAYIKMIFLSSFIAAGTTLPFEIYHFGQCSLIGLISNEIAIPIIEFILLPLCIVSLILMPLGLDYPTLWLSGKVGEVVSYIADFFGELGWGYFSLHQMSNISIGLISLGIMIVLTCWKSMVLRFSGGIVIVIGFIIYIIKPMPDMIITRDKNIIVRVDNHKYYSLKAIQPGSFLSKILIRYLGSDICPNKVDELKCEGDCLYKHAGKSVYIVRDIDSDIRYVCDYDVIVNLVNNETLCDNAKNITLRDLKYQIYIPIFLR